jgi:hypothetical protein
LNPIAAARLAYGTTLLALPRLALGAVGSPQEERAIATARILGVRHILQGVVQRRGALSRVGASVDTLHAITMAGLAAVSERYRRAAVIDGSIAAAFAIVALVSAI